jgi:hypothetical protein
MAGFSGGGGHMQNSCRIRTSRSSPPSIVIISRIRGEVEVRYVRCVRELNSGRAAVVSSANKIVIKSQKSQKKGRAETYHVGRIAEM